MNPAAQPLPVQDVQGDARWISQVTLHHTGLNLLLLKSGGVSHFYFITTQFVHLFLRCVCVCVCFSMSALCRSVRTQNQTCCLSETPWFS
uniref:Uncharacterized protein n=1 Tax=Cyprinus carpio TaxID=7962 RepID=A0A8C2JKI3_CYPCA